MARKAGVRKMKNEGHPPKGSTTKSAVREGKSAGKHKKAGCKMVGSPGCY